MQYSPKLKIAAAEIKAILDKHDIAGIVVLHNAESYANGHTQGFGEYLYKINPSYSIASVDGDKLRIRTQKADAKALKEEQTSKTYNMFSILADLAGPLMMGTFTALEMLEAEIEVIKKDPGTHTSHNQQNN